jgi:outer membrane protein OmpA-like peptidoglycan-associated protein
MFQAGLGLEYPVISGRTVFLEVSGETKTQKSLSPELDPIWGILGFTADFGIVEIKGGGEYLLSVKEARQEQIINGQVRETGLFPHFGVFLSAALSGTLVSQDSDKDGVLDRSDKCPASPEDRDGFEDDDGCPDTDNDRDGIVDMADKCPDKPEDMDGFQDHDGCPDLDNDNDGIFDAEDRCINTPEDRDGFEDDDGCPDLDNDKDGIPDSADKCLNSPEIFNGIDDRDGCPDGRVPVLKAGEVTILPDVKFNTGEALLPAAFDVLNELAAYLKNHPDVRLMIRAHTDALGSMRQNVRKSEKRAEAVQGYLIGKGVDPARLTLQGVGETEPIASNETAAGREKNNRVEIQRLP